MPPILGAVLLFLVSCKGRRSEDTDYRESNAARTQLLQPSDALPNGKKVVSGSLPVLLPIRSSLPLSASYVLSYSLPFSRNNLAHELSNGVWCQSDERNCHSYSLS